MSAHSQNDTGLNDNVNTDERRDSYPGEDGEEGEGDGCPSSVGPLHQWVVLQVRHLPLVGQQAETHEPHE